jgi:predicted ArsR family transcriptional regulator
MTPMTTPNKILTDLLISQSTTDALAERMRLPMLAVRAMCERHEKQGLLESIKIAGVLTVWRLTDMGRDAAATLNPTLAANPYTPAATP